MATISQVVTKTLKRLRVLEAGDTATNDDITDVTAAYEDLHDWLVTKNAVTWDADDDIPGDATWHVVAVLAARLADDYAVPHNQALKQEAFGIPGYNHGSLGELIDLAKNPHISTTTPGIYY